MRVPYAKHSSSRESELHSDLIIVIIFFITLQTWNTVTKVLLRDTIFSGSLVRYITVLDMHGFNAKPVLSLRCSAGKKSKFHLRKICLLLSLKLGTRQVS